MLRRLARSGGTSARRAPRDASEGPAPPSPEPRGGKGGVVPLDERRRANAEGASPSVTPSSSGDGSVTPGKPGSFGYKHQEVDSSSSLGDLNEVAEFVVPERVPEKIPHKATGLLFWACTAYLWYRIMGWLFLPAGVYFALLASPAFAPSPARGDTRRQHAAQVGIVVMIYGFLLSALLVYPSYFLFYAHPWLRAAFVGYVAWFFLVDAEAPQRGARFQKWTRRLPFWNTLADYFPVRLHKSVDLDPRGNYLFGYHPHGIIGVGALITFATNATGFERAFPGLDLRLLTLAVNFYFPFTREVLLALGIGSVSKESVLTNLTRTPGSSVAIVIGGAAEALDARPGWATLTLARRKGFVKMALATGSSLVPVFAFGENDIFEQVDNPDGSPLRKFQLWMKQLIGITPPAFYGRSLRGGMIRRLFGKRGGVMPKRESIEVVVGAPIPCPRAEKPSQEQIDEYHAKYVNALKELYETHRRLFHKLKREGSTDDLVERMRKMKSMRVS